MANNEENIDIKEEQLVAFQLTGQDYGIDIDSVFEIIRVSTITKVPRTPMFVEGVINLRGKIIPVIDLCTRFNLPKNEKTAESRIIIVDLEETTIGMVVDGVSEVVRVPMDSIEPPPPMIHGIDSAYLRGISIIDSTMLILLNLGKVLFGVDSENKQGAATETA
jgi:purine-binding chemotaxis protein CheW